MIVMRSHANEDPKTAKKAIVNENGTWQTILKWGKND
jgi:hypothetical protein